MSSMIQQTADHQPLSCIAAVAHELAQMHMLLTSILAHANACNMTKTRTYSLLLLRWRRNICTGNRFPLSRHCQALQRWHITKAARRSRRRKGQFRSPMQLQRQHLFRSGHARAWEKHARALDMFYWAQARCGLRLCQHANRSFAGTPSTSKSCCICRSKFYFACARRCAVARVHGARARRRRRTR